MLKKMQFILQKWFQGAFELIAVLPLLLIIWIYFVPSETLILALITMMFCSLMGILLRHLLENKRKWVYLTLTVLLSSIVSILLFESFIVPLIVNWLFIYRGTLFIEREWDSIFPVPWMWVSVFVYFLTYFIFTSMELPFVNVISWSGVIMVILTLFISNNRQLVAAMMSDDKKTQLNHKLKNHNRLYIIGTLIVIVIFANFKMIHEFLFNIIAKVISFFVYLLTLISFDDDGGRGPEEIGAMPIPEAEEQSRSIISIILEYLLIALGYIFIIFVVIFLLIVLWRESKRVLSKFYNWIAVFINKIVGNNVTEEDEGIYVDEKESLFDWKKFQKENKDKVKDWLKAPFKKKVKWNNLTTNKEKVTFLYKAFLQRKTEEGTVLKETNTTYENIKEICAKSNENIEDYSKVAEIYSKGIYGKETQLTELDVDQIKNIIEDEK
ncbi:hypothetical protein [Evansella cellulosilytica]|uniref:DUF4129 domain-containing protein n=1 Tax=Evansella cellulosilytica (strain ATCC 21833 / DSM 2522 / FERM P-1141 / JCM 9156 / N-4) TaxID=649639 RepID=E6U0E6_EVAC2|nr:hypothetical protein [Evansella cellulosilytica]ADU30262.1 hypothetical protein Bcell_2000 [Evansella cellulosilytica DSM 2522]